MKNLSFYLPGIVLIVFGILIIIFPKLLTFILAALLAFVGITYIMSVNNSIKQQTEIKRFRDFFKDFIGAIKL